MLGNFRSFAGSWEFCPTLLSSLWGQQDKEEENICRPLDARPCECPPHAENPLCWTCEMAPVWKPRFWLLLVAS